MSKFLTKLSSAVVAGCALALGMSPAAHAQTTIYQDTFSRTSALTGTAPDIDTTGATWVAGTAATDGNVAISASNQAFLAFNLNAGFVYTLSATLTATSGDWVALGFTQGNTQNNAWNNGTDNPGPWLLLRSQANGGSGTQTFEGPNTNNGVTMGTGTQGTTYTVTLDTTASQWTYSFSGAGITPTTNTFATNPTGIADVGFGTANGASGTFDNFTLTTSQNVPEPSAYLLLGIGLATLLFVWRCKTSPQA